jgi:hypothetical protein
MGRRATIPKPRGPPGPIVLCTNLTGDNGLMTIVYAVIHLAISFLKP